MTVTINGTTGIAGTNGSAGTPAVQGEDTNTGIFFPAADTVAVATAGTERLRVDSSGRVGIGNTSPDEVVVVKTSAGNIKSSALNSGAKWVGTNAANNAEAEFGFQGNPLVFLTDGTERARIGSDGAFLIGKTATDDSTQGFAFRAAGYVSLVRSGNNPLYVNRLASDGALVEFAQATTTEGSISVSGTTVSYNGGHLSRWAQFPDNSRPELLKGTVMSNLDQMSNWDNEENEQLNCVQVSTVEGDANVAGVFVAWDTTEDDYNDILLAMTGDMVIRIGAGVTVARGDLLMSAGDGTAKPQGDDIVRSKTIAKVTSTHVSHTYADGSYAVPCVLMAC